MIVEIKDIKLNEKTVLGVKMNLPSAPVLLIRAKKGHIMCGYFNIKTAEKLGHSAVLVSGVKNFEDMLNAKVKDITSKAKELGVKKNMTGKEALEKLF